jgi:hypothetical protein
MSRDCLVALFSIKVLRLDASRKFVRYVVVTLGSRIVLEALQVSALTDIVKFDVRIVLGEVFVLTGTVELDSRIGLRLSALAGLTMLSERPLRDVKSFEAGRIEVPRVMWKKTTASAVLLGSVACQ